MNVEAEERCNILLVDDNADKLMAIEAVLTELGENIVKAASGSEALRLLLQGDFAVILLDVRMPIMDGFETAALIRQRPRSAHTPIIFVTAINAAETHVTRGYSLGAVDYIFAPVVPEILRAKVSVFIELYRKSEKLRFQSDQLRLEAVRRAESVESRFQDLLNRLNVGVFRANREGKVVEANPAFLRLLGAKTLKDLDGADLRRLQLHQAHTDTYPVLTAGAPPPHDGDVELRRADGTRIWVAVSKIRVPPPEREYYIDGTIEDITARKHAEMALAVKALELSRSNQDLAQFASVASHDLQEPLRMIGAYLDLLRLRYTDKLEEKALDYLRRAIQGSNRMREMIKALLTYSQIDRAETTASEVDAGEVAREVIELLRPAINEAKATVTCDPLPKLFIDRTQLQQVFQNLVSNALKFHGQEPPRVHISSSKRSRKWQISITDNGIGIDPVYHDQIFELFKRLHSTTDYPGTGIGLASCKRIVERFGGKIWIESGVGKGTTFHFSLPAVPAVANHDGRAGAGKPDEKKAASGT